MWIRLNGLKYGILGISYRLLVFNIKKKKKMFEISCRVIKNRK